MNLSCDANASHPGEPVPYFKSNESCSVWDHELRAMRFLANDLGKNGLCDQHHADWNDGLEAHP